MAYGGSVDPNKVKQIYSSNTNDDYLYSGYARANAESLGLDPSQFSGNVYAQRKGYELSGADLQKANIDWELSQRAANLEYDLSKKMFDETQSWQAQVQQMREAGINPLFGVTGGNVTGGADSPNVAAPESSNAANAVQGAQVKSQAMLGAGQVAVDAFRQAMSVPMMIEQVRGMRIENDRQSSLDEWYRKEIKAKADKAWADARISLSNAVVAEMTQNDKISQSSIETQAKRNNLDLQQLEKKAHEYQNKMLSIDADNKQKFVDLNLQIQAAELELKYAETNHINADIERLRAEKKRIVQETVKLAKECNLLDKDVQYADEREFLAYMNMFNGYITAASARVTAGANIGKSGIGGYVGAIVDRFEDAIGSAVETAYNRFGEQGFISEKAVRKKPVTHKVTEEDVERVLKESNAWTDVTLDNSD